eukprot:135788-Rhodomonas_salina.1
MGYPGVVHLRAAECMLQYLMGTYDQGITYSQLDPARQNVLEGWAKRQGCVTLSSSEAEFVAASQCWVEVVYLSVLLLDLGLEQREPMSLWEDNTSCIMMSENQGVDNVADTLTKSVPFPTLENHRKYLWGSGVPFSAYLVTVKGWKSLAVYKLRLE